MKIDWKSIPPGLDGYDEIPVLRDEEVDWSDPTHVPFMVMASISGFCPSLFDDGSEWVDLEVAALDAIPDGRPAVERAVRDLFRSQLVACGLEDIIGEIDYLRD